MLGRGLKNILLFTEEAVEVLVKAKSGVHGRRILERNPLTLHWYASVDDLPRLIKWIRSRKPQPFFPIWIFCLERAMIELMIARNTYNEILDSDSDCSV